MKQNTINITLPKIAQTCLKKVIRLYSGSDEIINIGSIKRIITTPNIQRFVQREDMLRRKEHFSTQTFRIH